MNDMTTGRSIGVDGFEIEIASEFSCDQAADHPGLAQLARADLARLGSKIDDQAVVCIRYMKAIPLRIHDST